MAALAYQWPASVQQVRARWGLSGAWWEVSTELVSKLRALGITIRSSIDLVIGTFCLTHSHHLLHDDRDFDHFEEHLGLHVLR